jgi:endonuclease/exonuclease/phosphatase family metal-dependent hydrolase
MKIMTFNLKCDSPLYFNNRWDNRKHMVYNVMKNYDCDIIGTQEVKDNMLKDLENNMDSHIIIGRQRCKKISSERNNILVSKKHIIHEEKTFWLSENTEKTGSKKWYSAFPRICTTAIVEINNTKIRICNTHLDHVFPKAREFQLIKLMEVIEKEEKEEILPMILMGDFNATPDSKLIMDFIQGKFSNKKMTAVQEVNKELYSQVTRDNFKRTGKGLHIDYIFVSEEIEVINAEIINYNINGKYPSDHYPLIAEVKIK